MYAWIRHYGNWRAELAGSVADDSSGGGPVVGDSAGTHAPTPGSVGGFFEGFYPGEEEGDLPSPSVEEAVIRQFQRLYYYKSNQTWRRTLYRGINVFKCPLDLWIYQELIHEIRPELIVETGTMYGGNTYFLADVCETMEMGHVITIDLGSVERPSHHRITYLTGSSTDPLIVAQVMDKLPSGPVLVILDSDHSSAHVNDELETYGPLVTEGSYVVVEDTNLNGHPVVPNYNAGPMEAVELFLSHHPEFEVDTSREKFMVTFSPSGYLRRVSSRNDAP
jgi:cephalosporin hydroxylase